MSESSQRFWHCLWGLYKACLFLNMAIIELLPLAISCCLQEACRFQSPSCQFLISHRQILETTHDDSMKLSSLDSCIQPNSNVFDRSLLIMSTYQENVPESCYICCFRSKATKIYPERILEMSMFPIRVASISITGSIAIGLSESGDHNAGHFPLSDFFNLTITLYQHRSLTSAVWGLSSYNLALVPCPYDSRK
jgi:hypothetical protein